MSRLEIDFHTVAQSINTLHNGAVNKLSSVTSNVRSIGGGVDGQIKARRGIGGRLSQAAADAQSIHQKLMSVETFMRQSSDRYQTMERQIQQRIAILGTIGVMSANLDAFNRISISDLELKIAGLENKLAAFIPALFDLIKDRDKPLDIRQMLVMAGSFVTTIGELTIWQIQLLVKTVTTPLPIDEDMLEALNREQYLYLVRLSMKEGPEGDWARQQLIEARALLDRLRLAYIGIGEKTAAMDMMGLYAALSNTADLLQQLNSMGLLPEKEVFTPEELAASYEYDRKRDGMVVINGKGEVTPINMGNLDELLLGYLRDSGTNLMPIHVYEPYFNDKIEDFLNYAISQGYDPRTFEYVGADIKNDPFAEAFVASQQGASDKYSEEAKKRQDKVTEFVSTGLDFVPIIGNIKSAIELGAGETMAGEELSDGDKLLAAGGIIFPWLRKSGDVVSSIAKHGDEAADAVTGAGKHGDEAADAVEQVGKSVDNLKNTDNFKQGTKSNAINHIFEGEVVKGQAVGFHYEGVQNSKGKVVGNIDPPNEFGVYRANVEVEGTLKQAKSTFFPKDWTPQQIVDEVNTAFSNKEVFKNNRYRGTASNGMTIEMIIKNGKIVSAYPLY
ncbi:EndoU domain-containing protein [Paenibacillus tarimensis]|uniref:EndoU domain-containing protein n=1 Tax=Paenibacillus tarimensis TaxID=416012 RepID=UPI001F4780C3|nr:EndoU domain-containing protein [Paenibacillus tarimensis]MCF2945434.1 EndoU domain-containing protein [Paenibacillus tarimensis]